MTEIVANLWAARELAADGIHATLRWASDRAYAGLAWAGLVPPS